MPKYVFTFLICSFFLHISCNNEPLQGNFGQNNDEVEDPNANATFQVNLNSVLFEAEQITAILNEEALLISGRLNTEELSINILNPSIGDFTLSSSSENVFVSYSPNRNTGQPFFTSVSGQLSITEFDEESGIISGNFSGLISEFIGLADDIQMSNGVFQDIRLFEITEIEEPGNGDEDEGDGENGED